MKLEFIGTRGNTDITSSRHRRHSSALITHRRRVVMIDCGSDWSDDFWSLCPAAIVLTHSHPDHAHGLRKGAPSPVFATADTWRDLKTFAIKECEQVEARKPFELEGITFEAFPVAHSIRAPAVGYRITAGAVTVFYVPDVVFIYDQTAALTGAKLYIGDGATMTRSMVRRRDERLFGHTPVRTQLTWCQQAGVPRAVFTHCGSEIIRGEFDVVNNRLHEFAAQRGVRAELAYDGMEMLLR